MMERTSSTQAAALIFRDIDVARLEGVRDPYRIDHFCPGINLIHGPNGIGKSRTALALQSLVWPAASPGRAEIVGTIMVAEEQWRVDLDGERAGYQRNGIPETTRMLVSSAAEHRDRYLLTLHDLLRAGNRDFAREITREAAGGYDFEHLRCEMGIAGTFSRPRRLVRDLQEADDEVATLRRVDQQLQDEERSLVALYAGRDEAISASERVRRLHIARSHADALTELAERQAARDLFPEAMRRMTGEEYEDARQLRERLADARTRCEHLEQSIERDARELDATGFAERPIPHTLIETLRHRLDRARQHLADMKQAERQREAASTLLETYRRRLAAEITEAQMATLDSEGLRAFSAHAVEMGEVRQARALQEDIRQWLGEIEQPPDVDVYRRGVDLLQEYLEAVRALSPDQTPRDRQVFIGSAAIIALQAIGLAVTASIWMLVLALLAVPLVLIAVRSGPVPGRDVERLRESYSRLGLAVPAGWSIDQVQRRLGELQGELTEARLEEQKFHRWQALAGKRQETEARWRDLNQKSQELLETYGIAGGQDNHVLQLIADAIDKHRQASDDVAKAAASHETASRLFRETLTAIGTAVQDHGGGEITDISMAGSEIEHLAARIAKAERLRSSLARDQHQLENELRPETELLEQRLSAVYASAGLEPGDDVGLKRLCDEVGNFARARKACDDADVVVRTRRAELEDDPSLLTLTREEIERELAEAEARAGRRDGLQARITEIETNLRQAREQTRLEEAIVRHGEAQEALESARQREWKNAAGRRLFDFVREQNHQTNRPAVLRVADDYFTLFTSGAYTLTVGEGPDADFLAIDTATGRALTLDQLSSGTRVQLLLAVRLAFITVTEQGVQVPIILDEVLGNTDDERASAIIDSAIEIARQGRQVFYFTAQRDEVGKWLSRLDAHDDAPASHIIDLADVRNVSRASLSPGFTWDSGIFETPEIDDDVSYEGLYDELAVAPVDFWAERPDGNSLWYFIPDAPTLLKLHRRSVHTWGQYLALARAQRLEGIWTESVHEKAVARAQVIEAVCREWRYGRPRPVTRDALRDSSLITERFWDEVIDCAESRAWDGQALIDALTNREVTGFYRTTTERLEEWFREQGHIVDSEPRPDHLVRASAFSAGADAIERGVLAESEIDELLRSMTGAPMLAS